MKNGLVFKWLMELGDEIESILKSNLGAKYKVMLLMTYIDIFSSTWNEIADSRQKTQKGRFIEWLNRFVIDKDFEHEESDLGLITAEIIYSIRNSLLHSGALPKSDKAIFLSELTKTELVEKHPDKTALKTSIVLCPQNIYLKVLDGFINTMKYLEELEQEDKVKFSKIMDKLQAKLEFEQAMAINTHSHNK